MIYTKRKQPEYLYIIVTLFKNNTSFVQKIKMTTMKIANKILLIAFGVVVLAIFAIMLTIRIELSKDAIEGSGIIISESRDTDSFSGIEVSGNFSVHISQGNHHSITVYADDNLLEHIRTDINRDNLIISADKRFRGNESPRIIIELSELETIDAAAGSKIYAEEAIHGKELSLELRSGAEGKLSLFYEKIDIDVKTGSTAILNGTVDMLIANGTTGSTLDAKNLKSVNCFVTSKSGSQSNVFVTGQLTAQSSSGGIIRYTGNPVQKAESIRGGGVIISYSETRD